MEAPYVTICIDKKSKVVDIVRYSSIEFIPKNTMIYLYDTLTLIELDDTIKIKGTPVLLKLAEPRKIVLRNLKIGYYKNKSDIFEEYNYLNISEEDISSKKFFLEGTYYYLNIKGCKLFEVKAVANTMLYAEMTGFSKIITYDLREGENNEN
jgi:hypothetical protein